MADDSSDGERPALEGPAEDPGSGVVFGPVGCWGDQVPCLKTMIKGYVFFSNVTWCQLCSFPNFQQVPGSGGEPDAEHSESGSEALTDEGGDPDPNSPADVAASDPESDPPGKPNSDVGDSPLECDDSSPTKTPLDEDSDDVASASSPDSRDSILSKKTLFLGEHPSSSTPEVVSEDEPPCSQYSDGWLGKCYAWESRKRKREEEKSNAKIRLSKALLFSQKNIQNECFDSSSASLG